MFTKGQRVEMTTAGIHAIRLNSDGTIRTHRHGGEYSATGVVTVVPRDKSQVVVRLDSMHGTSEGVYYDAKLWEPLRSEQKQCYDCEQPCDRQVYRTLARGPRVGQRIGPLCEECEHDLDSRVLLQPEPECDECHSVLGSCDGCQDKVLESFARDIARQGNDQIIQQAIGADSIPDRA